ncbi:MAG: TonB family protein [Polyangiaceae bacterium]
MHPRRGVKAPPRIAVGATGLSVLLHLALAATWATLVHPASKGGADERSPNASESDAPVLLEAARADGTFADPPRPRDPDGIVPRPMEGASEARPDEHRSGHGGDGRGARATNLADRDERFTRTMDLTNHLDRDQAQRLKTARERTAWEDRRATRKPAELTFVVIGHGTTPERRPASEHDPDRGLRLSELADRAGAREGREPRPGDDVWARTGAPVAEPGDRANRTGTGLAGRAPGPDHRNAAAVADVRPSVTEGPVTIPAATKARPNDTVDSEQEVSDIVRSIVHASTAGGREGEGKGGTQGGDVPGAGANAGPGSKATPHGLGPGDPVDFGTHDPRLLAYFRKMHAKIEPEWRDAFPREARLALRQGTVILDFVVSESGAARVVWPPTRPSGIDEFDANVAAAIRRAGPFEPIPKELGVRELRVRAPFVASNPIVR